MWSFIQEAWASLTAADIIQIAVLMVGAGALFVSACAQRTQAHAADLSAYMTLLERHQTAWRDFEEEEDEGKKEYALARILNLIEATCHLYNDGVMHGATREVMRDYLKEVVPKVLEVEYSKTVVNKAMSGPDSFAHLYRFRDRECARK